MRATTLTLIPALLVACSSSSTSPSTKVKSPEDVKAIYRESGLPHSSKYDPDIQGVPGQPANQNAKNQAITPTNAQVVAPVRPQPAQLIPVETLPSSNPWEENAPISPEEGQALAEQAQLATERYEEAKASADPKTATQLYIQSAELYIASTRIPDDSFRNNSLYNAACCYALIGKKSEALKFLRLSLQFGFNQFDHIAQDVDFNSIRNDEAFKKLIAEFQAGAAPKKIAPLNPQPERNAPTENELLEQFELADALYGDKKFLEAAAKYLEASGLESIRPNALYNAACSFALAGEKDSALETLKKALTAGYSNFEHLKKDTDLDSLRSLPGYLELLKGK